MWRKGRGCRCRGNERTKVERATTEAESGVTKVDMEGDGGIEGLMDGIEGG